MGFVIDGSDPNVANTALAAAQGVGQAQSFEVLEQALGKKAEKKLMPLQPGDVPATYADIDDLSRDVGFAPATPIEEGIPRFVKWYREFYRV
mgnify:CR=1 FL=1